MFPICSKAFFLTSHSVCVQAYTLQNVRIQKFRADEGGGCLIFSTDPNSMSEKSLPTTDDAQLEPLTQVS